MPRPGNNLCVISGTLVGGEVFATSWRTTPVAPSQAELDGQVADIVTAISTPGATVTALRRLLPTTGKYTMVRAYAYAAGASSASLVSEQAVDIAGTGTEKMPNQVSIVATLLTGVPGRRNRGRMFWPASGATPDVNGQLANPTPADLATAVAAVIGTPPIPPAVVSNVGNTARAVTSVVVDSRFDIIRARANKQAATSRGTAPVT